MKDENLGINQTDDEYEDWLISTFGGGNDQDDGGHEYGSTTNNTNTRDNNTNDRDNNSNNNNSQDQHPGFRRER